jgi:hypothetical protein
MRGEHTTDLFSGHSADIAKRLCDWLFRLARSAIARAITLIAITAVSATPLD